MTRSYGWNPQRLQHLRTNKYKLVEFWLRYSEENKLWTLLDSQSVCECLHGEVVVVCTGGMPVCHCTHQGAALGRGWNLLSTPALLLCVQVAEMLLMTSAAVNVADQHASTPLHRAASKGNTTLVKLLLSYHANPNAPDSTGCTPLSVYALPPVESAWVYSQPALRTTVLGVCMYCVSHPKPESNQVLRCPHDGKLVNWLTTADSSQQKLNFCYILCIEIVHDMN